MKETYLRQNFDKSDNVITVDGKQSQQDGLKLADEESDDEVNPDK
jgi:hypothetical protein